MGIGRKLARHRVSSMGENMIERIMEIIRTRFSDYRLTVDELATEAKISVSHLRELTCDALGRPPQWLIETVRLEEALKMIAETNGNLYAICKNVGYASQKAFRKAFRKRIGITPSIYREQVACAKLREIVIDKYMEVLHAKTGEKFR